MTSPDDREVVQAVLRTCAARGLQQGDLLVPPLVRARNTAGKVSSIPAAFCAVNGLTRAAAADLANDILSDLPAVRPSVTAEPSSPITSSRPPSELRGRSRNQKMPAIPTVLVVTALSLEASEVVAYLADVREVEHPTTGSLYQVGRFEGPPEFEVAVVVTGAGNESAATETERAIQRFNPTVALFVGVAGGLKEDVVIGDVVAADYVYDYSSAKEGAEFVQARIKTASASYAARQRAHSIASSGSWISLIKRPPPTDDAPDPNAFVKPIAAGPKLLASTDAPTAVWIRQHCGDAESA